MKILFTILLLQLSFISTSQNPTIFFDKTRCKKAIALEVVDTLPYSFSLVNHLQRLLQKKRITKPVFFSLWKLDGKVYRKLQEASIYETCLLPNEGSYFLQIHNQIQTTFLEIELTKKEIKSKIFFNCVIHD